ncbi:MAG: hypothetical protein AB1716_08540 [Planctomycetota bacterium]
MPVSVSGAIVAGGAALNFAWSPDGTYLVFNGDKDTAGVVELYVVPAAGGAPLQVSGALVANGDIQGTFAWSGDGRRVGFYGDKDTDAILEAYSVPVTGGVPTKLNGPLVGALGVRYPGPVAAPDGQRVAFIAEMEVTDKLDLYVVGFAGGEARKVNGVMASDRDVSTFAWSPLSN